jgi:hypothetical protein
LTSFFIKKAERPNVTENASVLVVKSKEELLKNPFIRYAETCETEAMKLKKAMMSVPLLPEWEGMTTADAIMDKFRHFKDLDFHAIK